MQTAQPRPVIISQKAQLYSQPFMGDNYRTDLSINEIVHVVQQRRWVYIGANKRAHFYLVWDHHRKVPIVFLVEHKYRYDVVISIWKTHYHGIPQGEPTALQVWFAWRYSLAAPNRAPLAELIG